MCIDVTWCHCCLQLSWRVYMLCPHVHTCVREIEACSSTVLVLVTTAWIILVRKFTATYVGMVVWNVHVVMSEIVLSLFVYFVSRYLHSFIPTFARFLFELFLLKLIVIPCYWVISVMVCYRYKFCCYVTHTLTHSHTHTHTHTIHTSSVFCSCIVSFAHMHTVHGFVSCTPPPGPCTSHGVPPLWPVCWSLCSADVVCSGLKEPKLPYTVQQNLSVLAHHSTGWMEVRFAIFLLYIPWY